MTLSPQFLDELRARTSLSALVGKSVKLQKAGSEYRACCPFHSEKSASFYVNDDKAFYHCFGCSAHGDAIQWMTQHAGLSFMDAVRDLAQAAGLEMPALEARDVARAEAAKGLHDACGAAAAWFSDQLGGLDGATARALLSERGIGAETASAFGLGYAPDSRGKLKEALKIYGDPLLVEAGLLIAVDDRAPYDRFRGRLMIPIRDPRGRVVAFGGRIIGKGEPKYLNSPDTPLFDKGRTLYNLDRAGPMARKTGRLIVVEGYTDVMGLAQAGIPEAVAPLGTALTEAQLGLAWRLSTVPLLCFDGDAAGQSAAIRAARRALPMLTPGRSLAFVTLPAGQDPDDIVRAGGGPAFEALIANAVPLVDCLWSHELAAQPVRTPEQRAGLKARLAEIASAIQHGDVRAEYQAEFRRRFAARFNAARREWRPRQPAALVGPNATPRPSGMIVDAIVAGVIRWPGLASSHIEDLARLRAHVAEPAILDAIIDQAISGTVDPTLLARTAQLLRLPAARIFQTETQVIDAIGLILADAPQWGRTQSGVSQ
jgi:DNA primase